MKSIQSKYVVLFSLSSVPLLFPSEFIKIIDLLLVSILSKVESNVTTDIIWIITVLYSFRQFVLKVKVRYYLSKFQLSCILIFWSYFLYFKYAILVWDFTNVSVFNELDYLDIIHLLSLFSIIIFASSRVSKLSKSKEYSKIEEDLPWNPGDRDLLGMKQSARNIAEFVLNLKTDKSVAIGISADWGSGKTSYMNMIQQFLMEEKRKDLISIQFNPWLSKDSNKIIADFFDSLYESLSFHHFDIGRTIAKYSEVLKSVDQSQFSKLTSAIMNVFGRHRSSLVYYQKLDSQMRDLGKKVVVLVDDIDRLDKEEVVEVIKLIRNTANLHNTIFIVPYEKEYIVKAISKITEHKNEAFLEKIFQLVITLPTFDRQVLKDEFIARISEYFPQLDKEFKKILTDEFDATRAIRELFSSSVEDRDIFFEYVKNLRDLKRLINGFVINYESIAGNILLRDYFLLCLFKLRFESAYNEFVRHKSDYLKQSVKTGTNNFEIRTENEEGEEIIPFIKRLQELKYREVDSKLIEVTLKELFDNSGGYNDLSIRTPSNFNIYFGHIFSDSDLKETDYINSRRKPFVEFRSDIDNWISKGMYNQLIDKLSRSGDFDNKDDFENVVKAWIHLINMKDEIDPQLEFVSILSSKNQKKILNLFDEEKELENVLTPFFDGSSPEISLQKPQVVQEVLRQYARNETYEFCIGQEKMMQIALNNLKIAIEAADGFKDSVFLYYYSCIARINHEDKIILDEKANKLIKDYIDSYFNDFNKFIIRPKYTPVVDDLYVFEPYLGQYYGHDKYQSDMEKALENEENSWAKPILEHFMLYRGNDHKEFRLNELLPWMEQNKDGKFVINYEKQ